MLKYFLVLLLMAARFCSCAAIGSLQESLIDYHPEQEKPFVIVITSYNNKEWCERNLDSIFMQNYHNYRVIYIDDHSSDETAHYVKDYVTRMNQWHRFIIVENEEWKSQMVNHYNAVYMCQDFEIVVHMDGDDWFAHEDVLTLLNKVYSKWDIWLTYGQYRTWPQGEIGGSRAVPENVIRANAFREFGFYYSHPRTFYAWLFKKIKLKDLLYKGSFIPAAPTPDALFMFPMIEMAGTHIKFIPDVLYCWNRKNSLSQHNLSVKKELPPVEKWEKYQSLSKKDAAITKNSQSRKSQLIIWAKDQESVNGFISSELEKMAGITTCAIFCEEKKLQSFWPHIQCIDCANESEVRDYFACNKTDYVLILRDAYCQLDSFVVADCAEALERTGAFVFFFGTDKTHFKKCNEPINYAPFAGAQMEYRFAPLENGMLGWQCMYDQYLWDDPSLFSMIMIKQPESDNEFYRIFSDHAAFKKYMFQNMRQDREIGLMHWHAKMHLAR